MKIKAEPTDEYAMYAGPEGLFAWRAITITATGPDLSCDVEITARLERRAELEKGYQVVEVRSTQRRGGPEVSGEVIRSIPVTAILREGAAKANRKFALPRGVANYRAAGPTPESLRAVATCYRLALLVRGDPTRSVAEAFGLPAPTASRWVQRARKSGFLGPTEPRKPGERADGLDTLDAVISGYGPGKGVHAGRIGKIRLRMKMAGRWVEVGEVSEMDEAARRDISEDPDAYIGRGVVVSYTGKVGDKLRNARLVKVRDNPRLHRKRTTGDTQPRRGG